MRITVFVQQCDHDPNTHWLVDGAWDQWTAVDNPDGFQEACERAQRLGYRRLDIEVSDDAMEKAFEVLVVPGDTGA